MECRLPFFEQSSKNLLSWLLTPENDGVCNSFGSGQKGACMLAGRFDVVIPIPACTPALHYRLPLSPFVLPDVK